MYAPLLQNKTRPWLQWCRGIQELTQRRVWGYICFKSGNKPFQYIWRWLHVTGENTCVLMILSLRRNQIFSCDIYVGKIRHKLDGDVVRQMALKRPVSSLRVTTTHPRTCPRPPWTLCGSLFRLRVCSRLSHLLWPPGGRAFRVRSQPAPDNYFWGGPETAFLARNTFFTLH